jgi:hypothetical protein
LLHEFRLDDEFLALLSRWDREIARVVAAGGCKRCEGPLHKANYQRKPRGGRFFEALDAFTLRLSLCCGHCRARSLPPSLLFLGRRVYIEAVVLIACADPSTRDLVEATGVPDITLRRWRGWWRETFPVLPAWPVLRAQFAPPPPDEGMLPASLLLRIKRDLRATVERTPAAVMLLTAKLLAPVTTSLMGAASFVRAAAGQLSARGLTQKM